MQKSLHTIPYCENIKSRVICIMTFFRRNIVYLFFFQILLLPTFLSASNLPIDSLMARVYSYKERLGLPETSVKVQVYFRAYEQGSRNSFWVRYVPHLNRLPKGNSQILSETDVLCMMHPEGAIDTRVKAFYSTGETLNIPSELIIKRYSLTLYSPLLFGDHGLSPLHHRNRFFYSYNIISSYKSDSVKYVRIQVTPHFGNTQLLKGVFDVEESSGRVARFDFSFYYSHVNFQITGTMGQEGFESIYPAQMEVRSRIRILNNWHTSIRRAVTRFEPVQNDCLSDTLHRPYLMPRDVTQKFFLRMDTSRIQRTRDYFEKHRPLQLTDAENRIYARLDTLRVDSVAPSKKKPHSRRHLDDMILGSYRWNVGEFGHVKIPPIVTPSMLEWSKTRGLSLRTKLWFDAYFPGGQSLSFRPKLAYNFKQRELYWRIPIEYTINSTKNLKLDLEVGNENRTFDSQQAEEARLRMRGVTNYDSIVRIFDTFNFNYYRNFYTRFHLSYSLWPGLELMGGLTANVRTLVGWNETARDGGLQHRFYGMSPRLHIVWTPRLDYYIYKRRVVPIGSSWPTFSLDYERGISLGIFDQEYERWEIDTKYKIMLYAQRSISLRLGGGWYTDKKSRYFCDFSNFRDNNMPTDWEDEYSGNFQLLSSYWYNESRYYLRSLVAYESPMLLLARFGILSRYIQKERLYMNLLNVQRLNLYSELGYGFRTSSLDLGLFAGLYNLRLFGFGIKVNLHLFEDW